MARFALHFTLHSLRRSSRCKGIYADTRVSEHTGNICRNKRRLAKHSSADTHNDHASPPSPPPFSQCSVIVANHAAAAFDLWRVRRAGSCPADSLLHHAAASLAHFADCPASERGRTIAPRAARYGCAGTTGPNTAPDRSPHPAARASAGDSAKRRPASTTVWHRSGGAFSQSIHCLQHARA